MKKFVVIVLCFLFCTLNVFASETSNILMEYSTKKVLLDENSLEKRAPASMTKIMTLLIIMERIDDDKIKLDDKVTISENASNMGGSQVYLQPNEVMSVDDLIKSICIASANDVAVTKKQSQVIGEEITI